MSVPAATSPAVIVYNVLSHPFSSDLLYRELGAEHVRYFENGKLSARIVPYSRNTSLCVYVDIIPQEDGQSHLFSIDHCEPVKKSQLARKIVDIIKSKLV